MTFDLVYTWTSAVKTKMEYPNFDLLSYFSDDEFLDTIDLDALVEDTKQAVQGKAPVFVSVADEESADFVTNMRNKNTVKKTEHSEKQFTRWLQETKAETRPYWTIPPVELDPLLGTFLLSIRKSDGSDYEPDTLTSYHRGIARALKEHNYPRCIVADREFDSSRAVLAAKRKELKSKGKGNRPYAAEPLSKREEEILQEKGCIGTASPQQLLNRVWLNNTKMLGIRGGDENRQLRWGDLQLCMDENEVEFLQFNERLTKTRDGKKSSTANQRAFFPKQFALINEPDKCPVAAYKEFSRHRPRDMCQPDAPFYLAINHKRRPDSHLWYKAQPLGENTLRQLMKKMSEKAGLPGRKTNHSARKTTCTRLLHSGVAPTTIQQLTGHRNVQSVNNYATASNEMQKEMSDILSGGKSPQKVLTSSTVGAMQEVCENRQPQLTLSQTQNTQMNSRSGHILQNAHFQNCTINIFDSRKPASPTPSPPKRKFKRIRLIDSSSDSD